MTTPRLTVRVDFRGGRALGPGKIRLLEAIEKTGSISQAGRTLGISYRRAWDLVDDMNTCFRDAVISAQPGGVRGGGATLTPFGQKLVKRFRALETDTMAATRKLVDDLAASLKGPTARRGGAPLRRPVRRLHGSRNPKSGRGS